MLPFTAAKQQFDDLYQFREETPRIVPVDGKSGGTAKIKGSAGQRNEEYYKWQFIYALVNSGLYAKDYVGVEVRFPKGNKTSPPLNSTRFFPQSSTAPLEGNCENEHSKQGHAI